MPARRPIPQGSVRRPPQRRGWRNLTNDEQAWALTIHCPRCGWASDHFGVLLECHRRFQHWTQQAIAAAVGVTDSCWSQWEVGRRLPTEASLQRIAAVLHLDADETEELAAAAGLRGLRLGRHYRPLL